MKFPLSNLISGLRPGHLAHVLFAVCIIGLAVLYALPDPQTPADAAGDAQEAPVAAPEPVKPAESAEPADPTPLAAPPDSPAQVVAPTPIVAPPEEPKPEPAAPSYQRCRPRCRPWWRCR